MSSDVEREVSDIDEELSLLNFEIGRLCQRKKTLEERRKVLIKNDKERRRFLEEQLEPDWQSISFTWSKRLSEVASSLFNFATIRQAQLEIMNAGLSRYDVLAVMKTGGGKSLCYQLPALSVDEGFTLVVSPLLALIRDQIRSINAVAPDSAMSLAGSMERAEQNDVYRAMGCCTGKYTAGQLRLLYVTPEKVIKSKLLMTHLQKAYDKGVLSRIVLDEAHCASQWYVLKWYKYF